MLVGFLHHRSQLQLWLCLVPARFHACRAGLGVRRATCIKLPVHLALGCSPPYTHTAPPQRKDRGRTGFGFGKRLSKELTLWTAFYGSSRRYKLRAKGCPRGAPPSALRRASAAGLRPRCNDLRTAPGPTHSRLSLDARDPVGFYRLSRVLVSSNTSNICQSSYL